jgi:class 3 adenylate cyclase
MDDPQQESLTLLFTDIENSTRHLQRLGDRFTDVLNHHRRLLRRAFAARGGTEVDCQGDAFFVVFERTSDAVLAAVDAQRSLASHQWPDGIPIRVRMGVHTGMPTPIPEGYVGIDVHLASRICDAGHGGQILLSQAARECVTRELSDDVEVLDLGEHRLKDLPGVEHLFQVVVPDLPASFPRLRSLGGLHNHIGSVVKAVEDGRLVIVLGDQANQCGRADESNWIPQPAGAYTPTDQELAAHLATRFDYPPRGPRDLARISQYAAITAGSGPLYEEIHSILDADFVPSSLHEFLAHLPSQLRQRARPPEHPLIITTAYDDTLERAFRAAGEAVDLVSYVADGDQRGRFWHWTPDGRVRLIDKPNKYLGLSLEQRPVIIKMHGAVDRGDPERDSFVVTEDDYLDYLVQADLSNMVPVTLAAKLRRSHILFLGCTIRDWSYRILIHRLLGKEHLKYASWAVHARPEPIDRRYWGLRDIEVIDVDLDEYVGELSGRIQVDLGRQR